MKRRLTHYFKREEALKSKVCSPTQSSKDVSVTIPSTNDIGTVTKCTEKLSDEQKCYSLTNAFVPDTDFNYPNVIRKKWEKISEKRTF